MLTSIRPAGNQINIKPSAFNANRFTPFSISLYQSGTASLAVAILASCKLKGVSNKKGEILLPAYACPDLISAVLFAGAIPILVDLEENSSFLSPCDLKSKITPNSIAIIVVNFLGITEQIGLIKNICEIHQLYLINDSAQWFPKTSGSKDWPGDFNIISFGRGKPVNLLHGGAVLTKNNGHLQALKQINLSIANNYGKYSVSLKIRIYNLVILPFFYGFLTRIPGLEIGETKFTELTTITKMNGYYLSLLENNIEKYISLKTNFEIIHQKLQSISNPKVIDLLPMRSDYEGIALLRYPLLITDKAIRDKFYEETANLGVSTLYKRPLNEIKGLEHLLCSQRIYPNASNFADHLVTLPTHENAREPVIKKIFNKLKIILSKE